MSGHSHAKTIKHQKEATDQKRGQIFSKMARVIYVAVKQGGPNPETNSKLRLTLSQAKEFNMPKENVERAIKRATGGEGEERLEEFIFEAYGPGGTAVIIEGITDNNKRTLGAVKQILGQVGGKLAGEGSVRWMFERKGCIVLELNSQGQDFREREKIELAAIEAGAQDFLWRDGAVEIYTKIEDLETAKKMLEGKEIKIDSASLDWVPKEEIPLEERDKEMCQKLFEALDENEDVQEIYSNLKS